MELPVIRQIGRFELVDVIGQGGMGIVYRAVDTTIGRTVAIKMLHAHYAEDKEFLARFYREVRSTATLQHKNIVTVYGLEDFQGAPYMVLEYLQGQSVAEIIASRRPMQLAEQLGLICQVCEGLQYAHQRQIIHRDIKPANVLVLSDGVVKIVDFGIARAGMSETITRTGLVMGSISYMSPEQITGGAVDARTDIYSAGITLFQLITGELPFKDGGNDSSAILVKILNDPVPPISNYLAKYPTELDEIFRRALAKNADTRYQTAEEFGYELSCLQESLRFEAAENLMGQAESSVAAEDWERARQQLQDVLKIDNRNTKAQELLRVVRQEFQKQQRSGQIAQLRSQAQTALSDEKYEEALECAEQALRLGSQDAELISFAQDVRARVESARKFADALRRGNAALFAGDLGEAQEAAREALALNSGHSEARSLDRLVKKELEERERRAQYQKLLEEARRDISVRNFVSALQSLKKAQEIDPADSNICELLNWAARGHEQEKLRAQLQQQISDVEALLDRESYTEALEACEAGLTKFPEDRSLVKLRKVAIRQQEIRTSRQAIDAVSADARALAEAKNYDRAIQVLMQALQRFPGEANLEILLSIIQTEAEGTGEAEGSRPDELDRSSENVELLSASRSNELDSLSAFEEGLGQNLPVAALRVLAGKVNEIIVSVGGDHPLYVRAKIASEEFELRTKKRDNASRQLEEIEAQIRKADNSSEASALAEKAKVIADAYGSDKEIRTGYQRIRHFIDNLALKREQARGQITRLVRTMQETDDVTTAQTIERQARELAGFWREDVSISLLVEQAAFYLEQVRGRKEQRLEELARLSDSLTRAGSAGQIRVIEDQARTLVASSKDPEIQRALDDLRTQANARLQKINMAVEQLKAISDMVQSEAALSKAEKYADEAADVVSRSESDETNDLLQRIQFLIQERKREYARIEPALERLIEGALAATKASELDLILARRLDLLSRYKDEPRFRSVVANLEQAAKERREYLAARARLEESGAADQIVDVQVAASVLPVAPAHTTREIEPTELIAPRGYKWLYTAGGAAFSAAGLALVLIRGLNPFVELRVIPSDANVTIDSKSCGNPCRLRLFAGQHQLVATQAGFSDLHAIVSVPWFGEEFSPFKMSSLQEIGTNPIMGNPTTAKVTAAPEPATADLAAHHSGVLVVDTKLPNAAVYVDGKLEGYTSRTGQRSVAIPDGIHQVRVEKQGYAAHSESVRVQGDTLRVGFEMAAQPAASPSAPAMTASVGKGTSSPGPVVTAAPPALAAPPAPRPAPPPAPPTVNFISSSNQVTEGQTVTLAWQTENATEADIDGLGQVPLNGSKEVVVDHSTNFRLTAKGPGGTAPIATVHIEAGPANKPAVVATADTDIQRVQAVLRQYEEAYGSVEEMRKVWPGMKKDEQDYDSDIFRKFTAIRLKLDVKDTDIQVQGDHATAKGRSITTYTNKGVRLPASKGSIVLELKKEGSSWKIDAIH